MGPETFDLSKSFDGPSFLLQAVAGEFLDGYELNEVENAKAAAEAGLPRGG